MSDIQKETMPIEMAHESNRVRAKAYSSLTSKLHDILNIPTVDYGLDGFEKEVIKRIKALGIIKGEV